MNVFVACQNDDNVTNEPEVIEIEESPIIGFDEIEKMTQNVIDGELTVEEGKSRSRNRTCRRVKTQFYLISCKFYHSTRKANAYRWYNCKNQRSHCK